jgi:dihydrofolate reductase
MRKVILGVAVSLDGFIEGPNGEYDWCPPPSQKEMDDFMNSIDSIFFGRKSFELVGPAAFPGKELYVFSNSLKEVPEKNVYLVNGDIAAQVKEIKSKQGKDIWLYGGASLTTTFINEGLIDEMWLGMVPILLGKGKPLFSDIKQRTHFKLKEAIPRDGYLSLNLSYENKQNK